MRLLRVLVVGASVVFFALVSVREAAGEGVGDGGEAQALATARAGGGGGGGAALGGAAASAGAESRGKDATPPGVDDSVRAPPGEGSLADKLVPWWAACIGAIGSAAYLLVLWVGLVGAKDGRASALLDNFKIYWGLKVPLYVAAGGAIAMVFQLPEAKLVAVQAFILGCTWPAVVANYLSGRQSGELVGAVDVAAAAAGLAAAKEAKAELSPVPSPVEAKGTFDQIIEEMKKNAGGSARSTPATGGTSGTPPPSRPGS